MFSKVSTYKIYLDVCCLNRPFDDASQERIRLESEAVLLIYRKCRIDEWRLVSSEVIDLEIAQTKKRQRREQLQIAVAIAYNRVILDEEVRRRATQIGQLGFQPFDAAYLASAEAGDAAVFLTTDDRLLRRATRFSDQLNITVKIRLPGSSKSISYRKILEMMTLFEINRIGYRALAEALGFDGMVRFLRQFETGSGDYTEERSQLLSDFTLEDIHDQIE